MGTAERVLDIARAELGTKESPANSNRVKYNTWYYGRDVQGDAYPWCMAFVQWCFDQAGVKLPVRTASCGALMRSAQKAGCWVTEGFRPGDVVIYDFPGGAGTDHTGIVESIGQTGVTAIEGNTSQAGSQSNGGMVCRKTRPYSQIVGCVRAAFDEEDNDMDGKRFKELWQEMRKELQDNDSGEWSREAREWAVRSGLMQGGDTFPDGQANYLWEDLLTREQAAVLLYRFARMAGMT